MLSMKKIAIAIIIAQSALGFIIMFYGTVYSVVDEPRAGEMLEYIQKNNPGYYSQLISEEDASYRREFYRNYTERGNRRIIIFGIYFLVIGINLAIPLLYIEVKEKIKSIMEEKHQMTEPQQEEEKEQAEKSDQTI